MSYTPTPQHSFPQTPFTQSTTSVPPPPPPKQNALQHGHSSSTSLAHTSATPPPPPPRPYNPSTNEDITSRPYTSQSAITSGGAPEAQNTYHPELHEQYNLPPFITTLSTPDLQRLLANPTLLHALLYAPTTSPPSLSQTSIPSLQHTLQTNAHLASSLLPLLNHLQAQRDATTRHLLQVRALEQTWRRKQNELEEKLEPWGPRVLHARLVKEIADGEAQCMAIEESWLEEGGVASEREVGEWIRRVREGREIWWRRRSRRERWDEGRVGGWR